MINKYVIDNISSGAVLNLSIMKHNYTFEMFSSLIKYLSVKYMVGLIDTNTNLGHNGLFQTLDISQQSDICSIKDVEYHVNRWIQMFENPILIINDVDSLYLNKRRDNESINIERKRIRSGLQQIALRYNIAIVAFYIDQN